MSNEWLYPTENVREEYIKVLDHEDKIKDVYKDIEDLEAQIEKKRQEVKNLCEQRVYKAYVMRELVEHSKEELLENIRVIKRWTNPRKFHLDRLKTYQDLLKTIS